jgi:putative tricarboxylic transport membrane protein
VDQSDQTPAVDVARKWHVLGFALLAAAGAYAVAVSLSLGLWRQNSPGEGLFPFITACAVTVFALAGLAGLRGQPRVPAHPGYAEQPLRSTVKRLAAYLAALVFYAAALDWLGFVLATILVVLFILRMAEGYNWRTTLTIAIGTAAGCHVLFVYWLGAILPAGALWDRLFN